MTEEAIWTSREIMNAVIGTGIISALASTILTSIASFVRSRFLSNQNKIYLCMKIASVLDTYAIECAENLEGSAEYYRRYGESSEVSMPNPPRYPQDVDWHSIDPHLAYSVMSFLTECEAQAASARHAKHFEGNPFEADEATKHTGKKAHELANKLRDKARLKPPDLGYLMQSLLK